MRSYSVIGAALVLATHALADLTTITASPPTPTLQARQASGSAATTYETTSPLPLTDYFYPYGQQPYRVNPYPVGRGPQSGYNICNDTTQGPDSQCQTAIVNSLDDFCVWGAPGLFPNQTVGDVEAATVAYCTHAGYGTRIFPPGTFSGLQFMRTPGYIQIVGLLNITGINLEANDTGGELDPHGDDGLGNPLGGLVYSTGLPSGDNKTFVQSQSWNNFIDGPRFCFKVCDPSYKTDKNYCQNIFDLIGCEYNMPADYAGLPGKFESCEGDLQDEVGTYTSNGQTLTWSQPKSLGPEATLPYTPTIPASSNCVTYQSTDLFPLSSLGYQSTDTNYFKNGAVATGSSGASGSAQTGSMAMPTGTTKNGMSGTTATASASATKSGAATKLQAAGPLAALGALIIALL